MSGLWSAAMAAAADAYTIETLGVPSAVLMERASLCVAAQVEARAQGRPVVCLVGPGNNGGDALAVARMLQHRGHDAHAWLVTPQRNAAGTEQLALAERFGVCVHSTPDALPHDAVWVDGLLGTGSRGAPRGPVAEAIVWLAERSGPVVAIDVPSGVDVDTGQVEADAVRADCTVTLVRSKPGLHVTPGRAHAGTVVIADIGIVAPPGSTDVAALLETDALAAFVARWRAPAAHKGQRGHVAVLGGSGSTPGAAVLAGVAAMRAGAGLCTLVGDAPVPDTRPELMRAPWDEPVLPAAHVLVVGPGLTEPPAASLMERLYVDDPRPAVWDASALDFVPRTADVSAPRVLTPHPGEAARMLAKVQPKQGWTAGRVQARRLEAVTTLQRLTGATVVLKGEGTVVCGSEGLAVAIEGTEALATAGSGDVLAGCIAAGLGRGLGPLDAACVGVSAHGRAGELAAARCGTPLALEVADALPAALQALAEPREAAPRRVWG